MALFGEGHGTGYGIGRTQLHKRVNAMVCHRFPTQEVARLIVLVTAFGACSVAAQPNPPAPDYMGELKACRAIADDRERLACYDAKIGTIVAATEAGDVRIVDREDVRRTKRQLFGFSVPNVGILAGDEDDVDNDKSFSTTIASASALPNDGWRFTTAEGAVWEIKSPLRRLAPIKPGDTVEFKKAALGSYFIRIAGQVGVKGRRVN
jgi:hypothetical protein